MTKDEFIDEKSAEWFDAQDQGCGCPGGNPPCSWCVSGYSLSLAEYLQYEVEAEFGPQDQQWFEKTPSSPHEDYDIAMKEIF